MKFILVNVEKLKENCITRKYKIDEMHEIEEIVINYKKSNSFLKYNKTLINKIKAKIFHSQLKKELYKNIKLDVKNDCKWLYILSKDVLKNTDLCKNIIGTLNENGGKNYIPHSEMDENLVKYVTEHVTNNKLQEHEIKALFVYNNEQNIDLEIIKKCIKNYRKVNIYIKDKPTQLLQDKILKINKNNGTNIEVIRYSKKAFLEYNVVYFVDDLRTNYPRIRLDKTALIIDENDTINDKYNSNIIFLNNIKENIENMNTLINNYGLLEMAIVVRKTVN